MRIMITLNCFFSLNGIDANTKFSGFLSILAILISLLVFIITFYRSRKQDFENHLFQMFSTLRDMVGIMGKNNKRGMFYINEAVNELKNKYFIDDLNKYESNQLMLYGTQENQKELRARIRTEIEKRMFSLEYVSKQYEIFFEDNHQNLGHYFRYTYNIFKFIEKNNLSIKRKKYYVGLLQAQLSNDELGLHFYNALSKLGKYCNGKGILFTWFEDYNFLENIDDNSLMSKHHFKFYPKTKFKFVEYCLKEEEKEKT